MSGDRGDYRSFYCAFWDDPDVHTLTHLAYRVLTTLKGVLPPSGIGVVYEPVMCARCQCSGDDLTAAYRELEHAKVADEGGWIVRERNVVWLINGLRFSPNLSPNDRKHRGYITKLVAPLGDRRPIVRAFWSHYAEWTHVEAGPSEGQARPIEGPSKGHRRPLEGPSKHIPNLDIPEPSHPIPELPASPTRKPRRVAEARWPHFSPVACDRLYAAWSAFGRPAYSRFRNTFGPLFPEQPPYSLDQLEKAIGSAIFDATTDTSGFALRTLTPDAFVARVGYWVDQSRPILEKDPARAYALGIVPRSPGAA